MQTSVVRLRNSIDTDACMGALPHVCVLCPLLAVFTAGHVPILANA